MRRSAIAFSAVLLTAPAARAQASYSVPIAGVEGLFGGRAGSGTTDSILGGGGAFFGWRFTNVRLGIEARALGSRSFSSFGLDGGAFVSFDLFSLFIDSAISLGAFVRIDALARWVPSVSQVGFVPYGSVGLRVAGIHFAIAAGAELGLALAPGANAGFTGELRIGADLVEILQLCKRLNAENAPQPR